MLVGSVVSMKAIVIDGYGGSDRIRVNERPDPIPDAGETLVRSGRLVLTP